jgi:hypothetical protein
MGHSYFWNYLRIKWRLPERIRALSSGVGEKFRLPKSQIAAGLFYFSVSGGIGWSAYQITQDQVLQVWNRRHGPSALILKASLAALGLREVLDSDMLQRVLRSLPVSTDRVGRLWFSTDSNWVAVFVGDDSGDGFKVFCDSCHSASMNWVPASLGWEGFEEVIRGLEDSIKRSRLKSCPAVQKRTISTDPREIIY